MLVGVSGLFFRGGDMASCFSCTFWLTLGGNTLTLLDPRSEIPNLGPQSRNPPPESPRHSWSLKVVNRTGQYKRDWDLALSMGGAGCQSRGRLRGRFFPRSCAVSRHSLGFGFRGLGLRALGSKHSPLAGSWVEVLLV